MHNLVCVCRCRCAICMYVCIGVHMSTYILPRVSMYTYLCMHTYACVCVCLQIHTNHTLHDESTIQIYVLHHLKLAWSNTTNGLARKLLHNRWLQALLYVIRRCRAMVFQEWWARDDMSIHEQTYRNHSVYGTTICRERERQLYIDTHINR